MTPARPPDLAPADPRPAGRVLVAGVGNIFLGDDGFGPHTVQRLLAHPLPPHVEAVDFGVRGVHLAYQLLDGYETLVLVDTTMRGGAPGTVYLLEAETGPVEPAAEALLDGHRLGPDAVLALLATLSESTGGSRPRRVLVVGCEPQCLDEGMELSAPVTAAVDQAVRLVRKILADEAQATSAPPPTTKAPATALPGDGQDATNRAGARQAPVPTAERKA